MIENASNNIVLDELSDEDQIFLCYITEDVGRILIVCPENAAPTITDFEVSSEYRNNGIGKALLLRGVEELIRRQPGTRSLKVKPRALDPEKISQKHYW